VLPARAAGVLLASAIAAAGCVVRTVTLEPLDNLAVRGFVAHADREWPAAPSQAQTADTLDWMASAVESLANTRRLPVTNVNGRVQQLHALIKEFASGDAASLDRTRVLRRIFTAGAMLVDDLLFAAGLEESKEGSPLRRAAESLDETLLPRRQPDVIERYFQAVSEALQRIDRSG
jgi:hypothetical protein